MIFENLKENIHLNEYFPEVNELLLRSWFPKTVNGDVHKPSENFQSREISSLISPSKLVGNVPELDNHQTIVV